MTVECLQGDTILTRPTTPSSPVTAHPAFAGAIEAIAASIVDALAEPLRAEIEAKIQQLVADAAQDIHARIVTAVGQIQPINIPINLLAQPVVQMAVPPVVPPQPAVVPAVPVVASPPVAMVQQIQASAPTEPPELTVPPAVTASPEPVAVPASAPIPAEGVITASTPSKWALPALDVGKKRPKSKNMGVTVVGLLPGQAHMIKNEFRFLKLTFVQADARNSNQLTALSKGDNTVIFMTDFIRHASVEAVRAVHGNWVYVTGGMTSLRDKLRELHQAHQQKADWL